MPLEITGPCPSELATNIRESFDGRPDSRYIRATIMFGPAPAIPGLVALLRGFDEVRAEFAANGGTLSKVTVTGLPSAEAPVRPASPAHR